MKPTVIIYAVIAIAVLILVVKDFFSKTKGDHTGVGEKSRGQIGLRGFLTIVFFMLFTWLWSGIFWQ